MKKVFRYLKRLGSGRQDNAVPQDPTLGIHIGTNTVIGRPRRIEGNQYISIGNNSYIGNDSWIGAYDAYPFSGQKFSPEIKIGNDVFIGSFAMITSVNKIIFEDGVEVADYLYVSDHIHSITPEEGIPIRKRRLVSRGYVKIGAYTAIGIRVSILAGVTLGKYCTVGAQSVVTRSFPDYSLIMGNPAVLVKTYSPELKKWIDPPAQMKDEFYAGREVELETIKAH